MRETNENNPCVEGECPYHPRKHYHVVTNNGAYVKYIIEKPKQHDVEQDLQNY